MTFKRRPSFPLFFPSFFFPSFFSFSSRSTALCLVIRQQQPEQPFCLSGRPAISTSTSAVVSGSDAAEKAAAAAAAFRLSAAPWACISLFGIQWCCEAAALSAAGSIQPACLPSSTLQLQLLSCWSSSLLSLSFAVDKVSIQWDNCQTTDNSVLYSSASTAKRRVPNCRRQAVVVVVIYRRDFRSQWTSLSLSFSVPL